MTGNVSTPSSEDPRLTWKRAALALDQMTADERVQTLVSAGILNEKRNLVHPYRQVFTKSNQAVDARHR